jgi:hypothetical protein
VAGHGEDAVHFHLTRARLAFLQPFPWGDGDTPLFKGHHNY